MKSIKNGVMKDKNYLDLEIYLEREKYIKNVNTKGTIENKLYNKYKNYSLIEFLKIFK